MVELFFNDIDYITDSEGKPVVRLFGLTKDQKVVIVLDKRFKSYFYVKVRNLGDFIDRLEQHKFEEGKIEDLNIVSKKIGLEKTNLIKITVKHPKQISKMKKEIELIPGFVDAFEYDIRTINRYIIGKNIAPLSLIKVKGNKISNDGYRADIVIEAEEIEQNDEFLEKPRYIVFDIEVFETKTQPDSKINPITMISYYLWDGRKGVISTKTYQNSEEWFKYSKDEKELLNEFVKILKTEKIEIVSGYNSDRFDFPYIKERCRLHKIKLNLGFDNSPLKISTRGVNDTAKIKGLVHVDLFKFISKILGPNMKTETFKLDSVAEELIGERKLDVNWHEMHDMWLTGKIKKLAEYSLKDSEITAKLFENIYPIIMELCKITQLPLERVGRGSYSSFVEGHLIKESANSGIIINKKPSFGLYSDRYNRTYEGAFVFEPVPGVYDNIAFLDFRSLYSTIVVSHNISPETINCKCCKNVDFCEKNKGFIPEILRKLIDRRKVIKSIVRDMDSADKNYKILKSRDYSLKTILNATYGYLGFDNSRWYSMECAASITAFGRKYIKETMEKAEQTGFKVLYGDTDSIAFTMDDKTKADVQNFLNEINEKLPGVMELELEKYYSRGIFVPKKEGSRGAKKRYALIDEKGSIVIKGLEFVRRDWANVAKKTQHDVLQILLKEKDIKRAISVVSQTIKDLKKQNIPVENVTIYTQIKKKIEQYASKGPHVVAAIKAREMGYKISPGTLIRYVVTKGKGSISNRSVIFEEVVKQNMEYDSNYYINNQVIPAVKSIFSTLNVDIEDATQKDQQKLDAFFGEKNG